MQIIRITALWCTSCLLMKNRWKTFFKDHPSQIMIDFDFDDPEFDHKKWNVGNILPVMIILSDDGKELKRIVGEKSLKELEKAFEEVFS